LSLLIDTGRLGRRLPGKVSCHGRALFALPDGTLYRSLHFEIYCSKDQGRSWQHVLSIPCSMKRRIAEPFRLICRLLRHEVRGLLPMPGGGYAAATRSGVYWAAQGETTMRAATIDAGGSAVKWPMALTADPQGRVLWGEYWGNTERRQVRIFASEDCGRSYCVAYTFAAGETRHVHSMLYDIQLDRFWVFCGDHDQDPGIGLLDFSSGKFDWVLKGRQMFRSVCAFDMGDHLVYATDTEVEPNGIHVLDKRTGAVQQVAAIDGSCIYATRCGDYYIISTTAEPLKGGQHRQGSAAASIWMSNDAYCWRKLCTCPKDAWSYKYFQFGSLVLPRGHNGLPVLMVSGQAIRKMDGKVYTIALERYADL
jgi:hypothetical protein